MFLLDPHLLWHTATIRKNTLQCFHEWIKIIDADQSHWGGLSQSVIPCCKIINLVREPFSLACFCPQKLQLSRESVTAHCLQQSSEISFLCYWIWLKWAEPNKAERMLPNHSPYSWTLAKRDKKNWTGFICFSLEMKIEALHNSFTNPLYAILLWG